MRSTNFLLTSVMVGAGCLAAETLALDWPQWQGPDRNAISQETGLLQEWPEGGPPLAWRVGNLGGGYSAPAVAGGSIYGMSHQDGQEVVWALSESDGKTLWKTALGPAPEQGMPQGREGPGCTPTVDGDRLYVIGLGGVLACLRTADGKVLWQKNLVTDFGGIVPTWSYRESPLIDGNRLICTPGGDDALMVALDKMTGAIIWKNRMPGAAESASAEPGRPPAGFGGGRADGARGERGPAQQPPSGRGQRRPGGFGGFGRGPRSSAAYASAIVIEAAGRRQYVQFVADAVVGVDPMDGRIVWRYDRPANRMGINCSTPLFHDGMVFAASAYGAGGGLARLVPSDDGGVRAEEVWSTRDMENHHGGVVLVDGCLYGANGGNGGGYLVCLDWKTGEVLWNERDRDKRRAPKGSIAYADGRLYYRTEQGTVLLIEPSRERYIERGRFEQPDRTRQPAWTHPVIANGRLYIRDQDTLFSYDIRRSGN